MLFNSYTFLFLFLPVTLLVFFRLGQYSRSLAGLWMLGASLFFYAWWNPAYVALLLASILFNYAVGRALAREHSRGRLGIKRAILAFGISADLGLLAYFKYANFFVSSASAWMGNAWHVDPIVLPLGISFFTFTQIAFLVDACRGEVKESNFIHYGLFVTYFPHLIAGPVLHHKEMMPQFARSSTYRMHWENFSVGLTLFAFGLFKKVVLADGISPYANAVFAAASQGRLLTFPEAWGGALAYTFQLYFDFSGYTDMALGMSCLIGVKLPINFNSPYKAVNIIDFWRRWHMTLSRFLRDYLYFPLGGNRRGPVRRYFNLMATMLLGGLWHGAGWTFVLWGGLHGMYLVVNHAWHGLRAYMGYPAGRPSRMGRMAGTMTTFLAVVIAWVCFRAPNLHTAQGMIASMVGLNGITLPGRALFKWGLADAMEKLGIHFGPATLFYGLEHIWLWIAALWALAWFAPNSQQIMAAYQPTLEQGAFNRWLRWSPNGFWLTVVVVILLYAVTRMEKVSEFLYFQF
ncbi:MAG: MBOAT family protein [Burkholderiales bacterium]|nr:MBOAT family protein [Burkholderiales bacterium]